MEDTISQILTTQSIDGPLSAGDAIREMAALGSEEPDIEDTDSIFEIGTKSHPAKKREINGHTSTIEPELGEDVTEEPEVPTEEPTEAPETTEETEEPTGKVEVDWGDTPVLEAQFGERQIDIPEGTLIPVKINGETVSVPLTELRANFSGKVVWQKHFHDLKQQQKLFEGQVESYTKDRAAMLTLSKSDPYKALEMLHLQSGEDPSAFLDKFIEQSEQIVQAFSKMTPEQRKAIVAHKKLELKKLQLDKEKEAISNREKALDDQKNLNNYIATKQKELGVSDAEFSKGLDIVANTEGIDISGRTETQLADMVFEYILKFDRPYSEIEAAVAEVAPKYIKNNKFIKSLFDIKNKQSLTNEELKKTIKLYVRDEASKNGNHTKTATPATPKAPVKASSNGKPKAKPTAETQASDKLDPLSMDDILSLFS